MLSPPVSICFQLMLRTALISPGNCNTIQLHTHKFSCSSERSPKSLLIRTATTSFQMSWINWSHFLLQSPVMSCVCMRSICSIS
uniref:Uncharacterized protein n=1 Tax=Anguilla anguilla TaxID=7936 RepID=A0A0E9WNL0_ANGAN